VGKTANFPAEDPQSIKKWRKTAFGTALEYHPA
jgi:hypothetical protein